MNRSAQYVGEQTFVVEETPVVPPGPGQVRLDVAYTGICGTDLHIAHGAMDQRVRVPAVIGHEMSGRVAEVGAGVDGFRLRPAVLPHDLTLITRALVPALRSRGLFRVGYPGGTLRDLLGLPRPASRYAVVATA